MALNTTTTVSVGEQTFGQFHFLHLKQSMKGHHAFELGIRYDWLTQLGPDPIAAGKSLLGKETSICIRPVELTGNLKPLLFNGIVTTIKAGKENNGNTGNCILSGNSPTILLSGSPHIQSYEQLALSSIVNTVMKNCYPFSLTPQVNPLLTLPLKYIVQYKESGFDFLNRLSQRYGEHFFYNGRQVIFGQYMPQKTTLVHQEDLVDFQLECKLLPAKLMLHISEYRQQEIIEEDTLQQACSVVNSYTRQAQSLSGKFYHHAARYKVPYAFSSHARAELSTLASRYRTGRMSEMILLKGCSTNTGLQIGNIVNIREKQYPGEGYGEFILTSLEHHCNGNGDYYNTFEGVPADAAMPAMNLENIPHCEAQSATVTDNHDPKGLGRIRVRFSWQKGHTPWIRLLQPHAGSGKGFYFIPEINEEVWVDFEGGNPEAPYATGCAYNGSAGTKYGDAMNNIKIIKTRSGHSIRLDDTAGSEHIIISDKGGNTFIMDTNGRNISLSAPEKINLSARNINIQAAENIDINAGFHMNHTAGMDMLHSAGDCLNQFIVNDYRLTAANITQIARENIEIDAKEIGKNAEEINVDSAKEDMQLSAGKSVSIKSAEKSKLF
jgi:uncharacterized protein involved in type VI secretion and phage assembly